MKISKHLSELIVETIELQYNNKVIQKRILKEIVDNLNQLRFGIKN